MKCNDCLRKDYCPWIHQFNHDTSVGCIDFQDKDYTTYISNTLNEEIDCKYDLATTKHIYSDKLYLTDDIKSIIYKDKEYDLKILKAFDIIKEKDIDVGWLKRAKDLNKYNSGMGINSYSALTPQEYELLKGVLL